MKKFILFLCIIFSLMLYGCNTNVDKTNEVNKTESTKVIEGYIFINDNKVYVDRVEIIKDSDTERIEEIGIDNSDMPNGYYIYNPTFEQEEYNITNDTAYDFVDYNMYYIEEEKADGDRKYRTNNIDEFIKGSSYPEDIPLEEQTIPYIIELQGDNVYSITEEFFK